MRFSSPATEATSSSSDSRADSIIAAHQAEEARRASQPHYGFVAQEMQQVFPELVEYNVETDEYSIKYSALIPLLVEGLQELRAENQRLGDALQALQGEVGLRSGAAPQSAHSPVSEMSSLPVLYGNKPNPFSHRTIIEYYVPLSTKEAYIGIFDMQGKLKESLPCVDYGKKARVHYAADRLAEGMYLYSLIVEGEEVATKKMILKR